MKIKRCCLVLEFLITQVANCLLISSTCSAALDNSSYGPSILWILHDATSLHLYNLRASVCRQVLDHLETCDDDWSEDYKSNIINACSVCMDQEHPERFIDDLESKQQQPGGKRRHRSNITIANQSIPDRFASPGFPLLLHIQIYLLRHEVERAAELTRKMDLSLILNDEVRDDAWFNIWRYLLGEGNLFLDGNLDTPGYVKKRDFLYTFMACQVSQKAKMAMTDFYQEVATRICEHENSSLEEKQYVIFACQQTVLRLLFKIRGLGLNTIVEFVQDISWPIEIPGQKAEEDLKVWSANFLLQKRKVPSSLIDETTGLVDLFQRFESVPETPSGHNLDSTFTATKNTSPMGAIESSAGEKESNAIESKLSSEDDGIKPSIPVKDSSLEHHPLVGINPSSASKTFHEVNESNPKFEIDEDDNGVVILDSDNENDEALAVGNEAAEELLEIDDDDEGEEVNDSYGNLSDEDEKLRYSDDDEDVIYDAGGTDDSDEENTGFDDDGENYQDEEETELLHVYEGEATHVQGRIIGGDNSIDDTHGQREDELHSTVGGYEKSSNDDFSENRKHGSDESSIDNDESDAQEVNAEDVGCDESDGVDASINLNTGDFHDNSNTSDGEDTPVSNNRENYRVSGVDIYRNNSDTGPEDNSAQKNGGHFDVNSNIDLIDTEKSGILEFLPSEKTASNEPESENNLSNDYDVTSSEHQHLQKANNVRTEVAAQDEFGDTTEEEDGNDRFKANNIAQADRLADALRSGVGYASQVEDGYEPEDTHGYTEEEVSEAIHTDDEEDENTVKQKPPLSDTDTSQKREQHTSHIDKGSFARPLAGQPQAIVGNADRQNSTEPTSDDMDMADEHTEQEEDVAAEFSELDENADGSFEPQKPSSESTQAKTLLEFAQKAQNKDNWGNLKDSESISDDVDMKRDDTQHVAQIGSEYGLLAQKSGLSKNCDSSFDADDEKYATEGCKSLETEEEEDDTEKDGVDISPEEEVLTIDNSNVDESVRSETKDGSPGNIASAIGHEDSGAIFDVNTKHGEIMSKVDKTELEATGNKPDECTTDFVGEDESDEKGLNYSRASVQKGTKNGDTSDVSTNEKGAEDEAQDNKLSDIYKKISNAESVYGEIRKETDDLSLEMHDSEPSLDITAPKCEDGDMNNGNIASGDYGITLTDEAVVVVNMMKKTHQRSAHAAAETSFGASNAGGSHGESNHQNTVGLMLVDDVCAEDKPSLSDDRASSFVANSQPKILDDDTRDAAEINDINTRRADEIDSMDDTHLANEDDCIDSTVSLPVKSGSVMADNSRAVLQDNFISNLKNDIGNIAGDALNVEGTDSQSIIKHTEEITGKTVSGVGTEQEKVDMDVGNEDIDSQSVIKRTDDISGKTVSRVGTEKAKVDRDVENEFDAIGSSNNATASNESTRIGPNQLHMQDDEPENTNDNDMKNIGFPRNEEVSEMHDSVENERSDIPQFIGGDLEQRSSKSTLRSGRNKSNQHESVDNDGDSLVDESGDNGDVASVISGASVISKKIRSHGRKKKEQHAADGASVSSTSASRPPKQASKKASCIVTETVQREGEEGDSIRSVKSETSEVQKKPLTRASTRISARSTLGQSSKNAEEKNSAALAGMPRKIRGGLPPRPPKETSKEPAGRRTRSKRKTDDELSAQTITSARSTRSSARNLSAGTKTLKQKGKETLDDVNDDDALVLITTSLKATRSSSRKMSSGAKPSTQKEKETSNDINDDTLVQTTTSVRSTRSANRKISTGTRASKQKDKETSNDDDGDDASVQTTTSMRSTRSAARKISTGTRASKRRGKETSNTKNDDDMSVQTATSVRSTRSATKKLSTGVTKRTDETVEATPSYSDWTVRMIQHELKKRKIPFLSKSKKKELIEKLISADST